MKQTGDRETVQLVYADTSLLVKRYVAERESSKVNAFLSKATVATSALAELELVSTMYAAYRAKAIAKSHLDRMLRQITADKRHWYVLDVGSAVISRARNVVATEPLRTADAIHCASALLLQDARGDSIPFATYDRRQRSAAESLGLRCIEP